MSIVWRYLRCSALTKSLAINCERSTIILKIFNFNFHDRRRLSTEFCTCSSNVYRSRRLLAFAFNVVSFFLLSSFQHLFNLIRSITSVLFTPGINIILGTRYRIDLFSWSCFSNQTGLIFTIQPPIRLYCTLPSLRTRAFHPIMQYKTHWRITKCVSLSVWHRIIPLSHPLK
jgi:hypothetical protein